MAFVYFTIASITSIWYFALNTEEQGEQDASADHDRRRATRCLGIPGT